MDNAGIEQSFARTNEEIAAGFDRYMVSRGLSRPTRRSYRDSIGRFIEMLGSRSVLDASRADIRELQTRLLEKGLSPNSLLLHTAALHAFYKFLRMAELVQKDPSLRVEVRRVPRRLPRVLTVEEVEALIAASRTAFELAVIEVLYATGVRVSELLKIRLEDINFQSGTIRVNKGKGGKDRLVPFGSHAGAAMSIYLSSRAEGFLFERSRKDGAHNPYSPDHIRKMLRRLAARAGVSGVHPHAFRRACATHMLASGAELRAVQELLGHEKLATTTLYTHLTVEDLKRIHERCFPRDKGESE